MKQVEFKKINLKLCNQQQLMKNLNLIYLKGLFMKWS